MLLQWCAMRHTHTTLQEHQLDLTVSLTRLKPSSSWHSASVAIARLGHHIAARIFVCDGYTRASLCGWWLYGFLMWPGDAQSDYKKQIMFTDVVCVCDLVIKSWLFDFMCVSGVLSSPEIKIGSVGCGCDRGPDRLFLSYDVTSYAGAVAGWWDLMWCDVNMTFLGILYGFVIYNLSDIKKTFMSRRQYAVDAVYTSSTSFRIFAQLQRNS